MRALLLLFVICAVLPAETGRAAWLRYAPLDFQDPKFPLPPSIVAVGDSPLIWNAREELLRGVKGMLPGRTWRVGSASEGSERVPWIMSRSCLNPNDA